MVLNRNEIKDSDEFCRIIKYRRWDIEYSREN